MDSKLMWFFLFYNLSLQSDGQTEVVNRTLGEMLRCIIVQNIREWEWKWTSQSKNDPRLAYTSQRNTFHKGEKTPRGWRAWGVLPSLSLILSCNSFHVVSQSILEASKLTILTIVLAKVTLVHGFDEAKHEFTWGGWRIDEDGLMNEFLVC